MSLFALPELLAAWSCAVDGSDPEETLQKGTHVRVFAGLGGTFPLAPFAVFRTRSFGSEPRSLHFTDRRGVPIPGGGLAGFGTVDLTPFFGDDERRRTVRADLIPDQPGALREVALLDAQTRTIGTRRDGPYSFSAPTLTKFRVTGHADSIGLTSRILAIEDLVSDQPHVDLAALLGLPVQGRHPWYFGVDDRGRAMDRVRNGAPQRLNPMDQPDGPFDPVGSDEEVARVEAMLASTQFGGGIEQQVAALVDDNTLPPWSQVERQSLVDRNQIADVPRLSSLQLAALDLGLARFLGFADRLDDLPDLRTGEGWTVLAVVGVLGIDPDLGKRVPHLDAWLKTPDADERRLVEMLGQAMRDTTGTDPGELDQAIAEARGRGLVVRAMVAVTAPLPPLLAPALPAPDIADHRWHASDGTAPSDRYRATFTFPGAPLAGMASIGALIDGTWRSRHEPLAVAGSPATRATPRMLGHEAEPAARVRRLLAAGTKAPLLPAGLLADENLPAAAGTLTHRFRASDFFGRFGEAIETPLDPPARPAPPRPVLRYHLDLHTDDLAALPPDGPVSPGTLQITFVVPQPPPAEPFDSGDARLSSAMAVPGLLQLAAGSLAIARAEVVVNGRPPTNIDLTGPGFHPLSFALDALAPQEPAHVTVSATYFDTADTPSEPHQLTFAVTDKRPLKAIETGIGLFWTSAPGPGRDVQLRLAWQAAANTLARVYVTDQHGLGISDGEIVEPVPGAPPSRGRVAEVGANKVLGGAPVDRRRFRLLGDPVKADAAGRAILDTTLARSLETVQFLRIVPLSAEGAEAPFDASGIVPVAVPDSRRPPLPRISGSIDSATGVASLTVTADGFDGIALRRDEPGLFDPGAPAGAVAPTFRIRRAVGAVADPIYARRIAAGSLARDPSADPDVRFIATVADATGPLEPFVRYVYWAEVRLPPERRLPGGVVPLDAGVTAVDPAAAADFPRPLSLPSAPRTLMRAPTTAPDAPDPNNVQATRALDVGGNVELSITIDDPPTAHSRAIGPYRLAVWTQWPDSPIAAIENARGADLDGSWPSLADGPVSTLVPSAPAAAGANPALQVRVAFVDPLGRVGAITSINVP